MTGDDTASLIYLSLFLLVIGGSFLLANRRRMGQVVQQGAIWFFIFLGVAVVIGSWDRISQVLVPSQSYVSDDGGTVIELPRQRDGHYHITLGVNGVPVDFLVDTGATDLVLSADDAMRSGLDLRELAYMGRAQTANGMIRTARVFLDEVTVGDTVDRDVRAIVGEGDLGVSLLGMSYLQKYGRIEIEGDVLRLIR